MKRNVLGLPTLALILFVGPLGAAGIDTNLLSGLKARSIGPAGMSGRVAAIDAVESNPDLVYVGAATGGVWKSTNGGLSFDPVFDDQPVAAIGAIAIFQANPSIIWVGTGEGNVRNSASVGNGIYRSLDGGTTWSHLGLDGTERIHRIALDPTNPNVAWVAALGRAWGENPERGVFKTIDGGKSWRKVLYVDEKTGAADVAIDPAHPNHLLASTWQYRRWPYSFKSGGPGSGLWSSFDGGETWERATEEDGLPGGELGRIGLAFSRSRPEIVYAMVEAGKSALLRSEDGGKTWKTQNSKPDVNPRPFYFGEIRVDPLAPNRVFSLDFDVRISEDSGTTLESSPFSSEIHGDYHALWIDPANARRMYIGDDGGVAVSHDGGKTAGFITTLPLAQYYHVAVDDDIPYHVYGGLQDNGSWRGPSSAWQRGGLRSYQWDAVGGGDGFDTVPDPTDSMQGYAMWQGGNLSRWNLKTGEARDVKPPAPLVPQQTPGKPERTDLRFNWNAGFAIDPFDPATIYLGSQFLHRSKDRGETWEIISPDLTSNNPEWQKQAESGGLTLDVSGAENYTTILAIAPSPIEQGTIWVGTDDGRLQVTRDAGKSWTSVEKNVPGVPANTWIPHVKASRQAGGTAFVVFDDHRRSNWTTYVVRTDDYGKTWKSLSTPELRGYSQSIEQDPVDPNLLFLGTEFGLWVSFDGGKSWSPWRQGVPTVGVYDLVVQPRDGDLVIATHGRALYVIDGIRPLRHLTAEALTQKLHLFEIGDVRQHWRGSASGGGYGLGHGEYEGENRPYGALIAMSVAGDDLPWKDEKLERARKAGVKATDKDKKDTKDSKDEKEKEQAKAEAGKIKIVIRDGAGQVVRTVREKAYRGLNRIVWNLDRDAFRQPPAAEGEEDSSDDATGPELPPGTYAVTVEFRGEKAEGSVKVLPDPRTGNTAADWAAREAAIVRSGKLQYQIVAAIEKIRDTRKDIDAVAERVTAGNAEAIKKHEVVAAELPLIKQGEEVKEGLAKLEKKAWQSPEIVGIVRFGDVFTDLNFAQGYITSSWAPPSPTHLAYLDAVDATYAKFKAELDAFFADAVAKYREKVREAKIELVP
ncbi:MAG TPA: hypothetical protein VGS22_23720 [Thermoanaerobaculia bacterium]|jgi:photosystem II stability/assembly factor-like uncharacterized protein|nr:hypothetical protein [Thermoanaerobaculia bacterium]